MKYRLTALLVFFGLFLHAQMGKVELGTYCGDDHRSPTREIERGLRALNMADYPNAQVYIGAALRQNEDDQHALYLRGELSMRTGKFQIAEASWKRLVQRCPAYKPELLFMVGTLVVVVLLVLVLLLLLLLLVLVLLLSAAAASLSSPPLSSPS